MTNGISKLAFSLIITLFFINPSTSKAITYSYNFSGTVTNASLNEIQDPLPQINVGDNFTGIFSFEFDPSLQDMQPYDSNIGIYDTQGYYKILFSDFVLSSNIQGYVPVNIFNNNEDKIIFYDFQPDAGVYTSDDFKLEFVDENGIAFGNDYLPSGLNLTAFSDISIWFDIYGPSGFENPLSYGEVFGRIDSIYSSPTPIPEPSTGFMALIGLCLILILNFLRRNNDKLSHSHPSLISNCSIST